jgi:hypothetical protein
MRLVSVTSSSLGNLSKNLQQIYLFAANLAPHNFNGQFLLPFYRLNI